MTRILALLYGVACYAIFFVTFLYAAGFVGGIVVPKRIDTGAAAPLAEALIVNLVLLAIFALQHSVMARPGFKRWWTQYVPAVIERSTYVLLSSLALILLFWQWRAMPAVIWDVQNEAGRAALWGLFWLGWVTVLVSTFLISHFDLFGLRQVWLHFRAQEYAPVGFRKIFLYRFVRHPIMLGFIVAFWATPHMSVGHLLFAVATTAYIVIALQLEERDLVASLGVTYEEYRAQVSMIIPLPRRKQRS
ncbi:MAG: isoprenylcysteine carboxylmethyltransferase family protein [Gammaproteobacteria bacterium]|nr:isoprenylcysteine carboxylmethyltransferase family protein [Gammaproteobacteria bacterium]